jgi:hypothetical protein
MLATGIQIRARSPIRMVITDFGNGNTDSCKIANSDGDY